MPEETKPVAQVSYVTQPVGKDLPESQIKISSIPHLMPVMWENSVKRIATLAGAKIVRGDHFVIVQFPKGEQYDEMRSVTERILAQAQAVANQREEARQKRAADRDPSMGLDTDGVSRRPKTRAKSSRLGTNVPVQVRRRR